MVGKVVVLHRPLSCSRAELGCGSPRGPCCGDGRDGELWLQSKPRERVGEQRLQLSSTWIPCPSVTAWATAQPVTLCQPRLIPSAPWPQVPEPSELWKRWEMGKEGACALIFPSSSCWEMDGVSHREDQQLP